MSQSPTSSTKSDTPVSSGIGEVLYQLTTPYRWAVEGVNTLVQPVLHQIAEHYIQDTIHHHHAENNPRLQHLLRFEIERRAYGPGQTQDVAEPIVWQGIKIAAALSLPPLTKALEQTIDSPHSVQLQWLSNGACAAIIVKESLDFFRLVGRYSAGLQGSSQMALKREEAIERTGVDPFSMPSNAPSSRISQPHDHESPVKRHNFLA